MKNPVSAARIGGVVLELSELTAYAAEKYQIREQHRWPEFPRLSVLADPDSGKWLALLMRQWDFETGTEIQRCDLKCGQNTLFEQRKPYLAMPYRMKGEKWIGVMFDERTEPEVIFSLFDRAVRLTREQGITIMLENRPVEQSVVYPDTVRTGITAGFHAEFLAVPEKIRQMMLLYRFGDHSFSGKCRNFRRQGKFMEDYEDDMPWNGTFSRYFPTYHDLNLRQLRGYFTWRTHVRKGEYLPIAPSLACIYVYELLNGIGTDGPADTLEKLKAFRTGFLDAGNGGEDMRGNLARWMLEYAVTHDVPPSEAKQYCPAEILQTDEALAVLENPQEAEDEAVFRALCTMSGKKLADSPVVRKNGKRGMRLFAEVWRTACEQYDEDGRSIFTACFGTRFCVQWHPLKNAVYEQEKPHEDTDYVLNPSMIFHCRGGIWSTDRYDKVFFNIRMLKALLHESDRLLRRYLKTGAGLRQKQDEAWASPYAEAVIRAEQKALEEAARPKIEIDLSGLAKIRQDADITRDSLMTEEEMDGSADEETARIPFPAAAAESTQETEACRIASLDALHSRILQALVKGESAAAILKDAHLMPSVAADTINEALFDEIGDNVLECDGDTITPVEDYREDILQMHGGGEQ